MSESPVSTHEVRELARHFERMALILKQGAVDDYVKGAAMMAESASKALFMLAATGRAEAVRIPIPAESAPKVEPGEDPIEQARKT